MTRLAVTMLTGLMTSAVWVYVVKPWLDGDDMQTGEAPARNAYDELTDDRNPLRSI